MSERKVAAIHGGHDGTVRRAYLTGLEVEALEWVRRLADHTHCDQGRDVQIAALSALDKIIRSGR